MNFDYFYGEEADSFSFYRIPRQLIKGGEFKNLSTDAKLLYGLLLDRMGISAKNNWKDANDRVFIYYPLSNIQVDMNCGHDKATKLLNELDAKNGAGLIERVKQGHGKPDRIYVLHFYRKVNSRGSECGKAASMSAEKPHSRVRENRIQECGKPAPSYTDNNYTDISYTHLSTTETGAETIDDIKEQIEYEILAEEYPDADCFAEIIYEVLTSKKPEIKVGCENVPTQRVQERFKKLCREHLVYVMDSMYANPSKILNIKNYIITMLYNAPLTIDMFYAAAVRHDMNGGRNE